MDEWEFTDANGKYKARVQSRFRVNHGEALREAALGGFGIILQAEEMLTNDLASGRLVRVLPGFQAPSRPMHILFAPDRRPHAQAAQLH